MIRTDESVTARSQFGVGGSCAQRGFIENRYAGLCGRSRELRFQKIVEAALFNIGDDSETRLPGLLHADNDDFIAKILASLVYFFHQRVKLCGVLFMALTPPLLQHRTLLELIVENLFGLAQEFAEVGNADI